MPSRARETAIKRLYELADTPELQCGPILLDLARYLNGERINRPKDSCELVQKLIDQVESSPAYHLWEAPFLQYKAKHLLSCNDFTSAGKLLREALNTVSQRGYGKLKGEVARDCLAVEVANQKLIPNNHERYYREMLAGGMVTGEDIPSIEDTARWASEYFWQTLYKPYPGFEVLKPRAEIASKKIFDELSTLFDKGDKEEVLAWIKKNRKILASSLPDVRGDSVLMLLIKLHRQSHSFLELIGQTLPDVKQNKKSIQRVDYMLTNWCESLGLIAQHAPKQINIADFKGQTPLMLMAEYGDSQMVKVFLDAGADPDRQDYRGMTALHSAIKSGDNGCVDTLLDHPCAIDKVTIDDRTVLHTAAWTVNFHAAERLLKIAPELIWKKDVHGLTPLELAEALFEQDEAREMLERALREEGRSCPTRGEFQDMGKLIEKAISK